MKDEQESLKTINKLTYDDLNKVNSDLIAEVSIHCMFRILIRKETD